MERSEQTILCEKVSVHDQRAGVAASGGEKKVHSGFEPRHETLRNSRLAERVARLWRCFKAGRLSGFDKVLVVGALLYCVAPVELISNTIPVVGCLADLAVVLGVLAYLDGKTG